MGLRVEIGMKSLFEGVEPHELPKWLRVFVAVTRPLGVNMIIAIPTVGPFAVAVVAMFDPAIATAMTTVSIEFLRGIPEEAWWTIAAVTGAFTFSKSAEVIKAIGPGRQSRLPDTPTSKKQRSQTTTETEILE
jgi:hypothetical protein